MNSRRKAVGLERVIALEVVLWIWIVKASPGTAYLSVLVLPM